jgi:CBS domain containing-hemolysin-like protein
VRGVSDRITTWIVGPQRASEHILQIDEFRSVIEDVSEAGELDLTSRLLINNLLTAGATEIVEIMTPRSRTVFLDADLELPALIAAFCEARHSRVPVYRGHRDNLVGFLYAEDVVRIHLDKTELSNVRLEELLHPPVVVPLTKTVDEMFDFFVKNDVRAAAALNEFGGVAGFVTVNDVLRFVFGRLTQPVAVTTGIEEIQAGVFEMPGDTKLAEFNRVTSIGIDDPRMTTIAGVAFRHIDRLPHEGDEVVLDGTAIRVLAMDAHRIARVRVTRGEDVALGPAGTSAPDDAGRVEDGEADQ